MEINVETCCGIDVHQKTIVCCILDGSLDTNRPKKYERTFDTRTHELRQALDCLDDHKVTDVFMESTGQYWFPVFNVFSEAPFHLHLPILNILRMFQVEKQIRKMPNGLPN